ncbi:nuclear transport factor 2 family protein [Luteolibacter flavescens]|uniref:Nuclear transport factor 2 family protein n=1 Tax=Luteolibacter flavescens TaxID=1859460 RepID=A0ABT3FKQ0_9BACT|nr:nuclear transport factor 2 family protein [Luteolibacter flavescens]MCW1884143.1 nuclear transport factor 2 family protein [Luteolibacter flavescens]
MSTRAELTRRCFEAYEKKDRSLIEPILADDFTFSSPIDDRISRESYFARCWPNSKHAGTFGIEKLLEDGDDVVVTYLATDKAGARFRNTEVFTFRGDQVVHVQVYFGSDTAESASREEIESVIARWNDGICRKDVALVAAQVDGDPVGYYLAPPLVADEPLEENLAGWFDTFDGPLHQELRDLQVKASGPVAWAHALAHLNGTKKSGERTDLWFRLTMGLEKSADAWKIRHLHESVPFLMDGSDKAALDLKP